MFASERESAVVDERGVVRLVLPAVRVRTLRRGDIAARLPNLVDDDTTFGDVGRALPDVYVLRGARIGNFAGMGEANQIVALVEDELAGVDADEPVILLTVPRAHKPRPRAARPGRKPVHREVVPGCASTTSWSSAAETRAARPRWRRRATARAVLLVERYGFWAERRPRRWSGRG